MRSLRKEKQQGIPPWHPDFRDISTLPDVKVVRTSFFINALGVALFAAAALLLGHHEVQRAALREATHQSERQVAENRPRHNQVVQMQRDFDTHARLLTEVTSFAEASLDLSTFLIAVGDTLPEEMILTTVRFSEANDRNRDPLRQLQLSGVIRGTPESAASVVTNYLGAFQANPVFLAEVDNAVPTSLVPSPDGEMMAFGIQITLKNRQPAPEAPARQGRSRS